jgi:4-pyridoxolactonase
MRGVFVLDKEANSIVSYTDVKDHWCSGYVERLADVAGSIAPGAEFFPDKPLLRGELAVLLDAIFHYPHRANNTFHDLPGDSDYADAFLKIARYNIVGDEERARPYDMVNRQEALTMVCKAFGICDRSGEKTSSYKDFSDIAPWAQKWVISAEVTGVLDVEGGFFFPLATLTRAEMIALLCNVMDYFKGFNARELLVSRADAEMKVYFLITGVLKMPTGTMYADGNMETFKPCPVYSVLIDHKDALILYDAGVDTKEIGADKFLEDNYTPSEKGTLIEQMEALGYKAEDVDYIVVSHLHSDHCADLHLFPKAKVYCNKNELMLSYLKYALGKHNLQAECEVHAHAAARQELDYELVGDETKIELVPGVTIFNYNTLGHAYGMLYLLIQIPHYGNVFVVADGVYDSVMYGGKSLVCREPNISLHFQMDKDGWYGQHAMIELVSVLNDCREIWFGHEDAYLDKSWRSGADYYS